MPRSFLVKKTEKRWTWMTRRVPHSFDTPVTPVGHVTAIEVVYGGDSVEDGLYFHQVNPPVDSHGSQYSPSSPGKRPLRMRGHVNFHLRLFELISVQCTCENEMEFWRKYGRILSHF